MTERLILRCLLVLCAGTLFGPLLFGCASMVQVDFVTRKPGKGVDLFVCAYPDGYKDGAALQCVDGMTFFAAQAELMEKQKRLKHDL